MRIVTGGTKLTSIEELYRDTGWEKLGDRRRNHKLVIMYKMINGETPEYLSTLVPNARSDLHLHFTRQSHNLSEIRTQTSLYYNYFLPSTIRLWNELPSSTRNARSLNIFKLLIKVSNDNKLRQFYYTGSRLGQVLHARLRMNSSSLNEHLFRRGLVDSPDCVCGQLESNSHFLLDCNNYNDIRRNTFHTLNFQFDIDILLKGSDALSIEQNTELFLKV